MSAKNNNKPVTIYLLLGSNLGNSVEIISNAIHELSKQGDILKVSSLYISAPWGISNQPDFINQAISLDCVLSPIELLNSVKEIEQKLGRSETKRWGPREIDIDILFYGDQLIKATELTIPHPRVQERKFALLPLAEIAPSFIHPVFAQTIVQLLKQCRDTLSVTLLN